MNISSTEYYPKEKSWVLESGITTGVIKPLEGDSGGIMEFSLSGGDFIEDVTIGTTFGYNYYRLNDQITHNLDLSLMGGYDFTLFDYIGVMPQLGIGSRFNISSSSISPLITIGGQIDIHITKRELLTVTPHVVIDPSHGETELKLLLGLKHSKPMHIKVTPIILKTDLSPKHFSPDSDGIDDRLIIDLSIDPNRSLVKWWIEIFDRDGEILYFKEGETIPTNNRVYWDGITISGGSINSASEYKVVCSTQDYLGNITSSEHQFISDIFVQVENGISKILVDSIIFPPNSENFLRLDKEQQESNREIIRKIVEKLKLFPNYKVKVVGHGNILNWHNDNVADRENENILKPLTEKRAEAVMFALIEEGMDESNLSFVGKGGDEPIVPFSDRINNWKNRRVEFILIR